MNISKFAVLFSILVSISQISIAQNARDIIRQLDSVGIHIYKGANYDAFEKQVKRNPGTWGKAISLLTDVVRLRKMSPGCYVVDGNNAYAKISDGPSKAPQDEKWESHRKYVDLQYVISGKEKIFVSTLSSLQLIQPYNEANDVAHYSGPGHGYIATPGQLFVFFPDDAHRTGIQAEGTDTVKKLVIKILMK